MKKTYGRIVLASLFFLACLGITGMGLATEEEPGRWEKAGKEIKEAGSAVLDATKETGKEAWDTTKEGTKKAWKVTKEESAELYEKGRAKIHEMTAPDQPATAESSTDQPAAAESQADQLVAPENLAEQANPESPSKVTTTETPAENSSEV